jgi:hypothetical protein
LIKNAIFSVNVNYFAEKHGKNGRDVHFSCISRFLNAESHLKRIKSSEDIANAIEKGQLKANNNRLNKSTILDISDLKKKLINNYSKDLEIIETFALALNQQIVEEIQTEHPIQQYLFIFHVESYYNYRTFGANFDLVTSVLSLRDDFMPLKLKSKLKISYSNYL